MCVECRRMLQFMDRYRSIIVKKLNSLKYALCTADCGYITQLKQQISKRCYYLAAHRRVVNVLTSISTF